MTEKSKPTTQKPHVLPPAQKQKVAREIREQLRIMGGDFDIELIQRIIYAVVDVVNRAWIEKIIPGIKLDTSTGDANDRGTDNSSND